MPKEAILKIIALEHKENKILATLEINKESEIFIGHFAGHPVLPGACMLQIIKEVLQEALSLSFQLKKADHIKFLSLIDPQIHNNVELRLTYQSTKENGVTILADCRVQNETCFKFKGSFIKC